MATAILTLVAGLIAALPQILTLIEGQMAKKVGTSHANAQEDTDVLDIVLPPPPSGMS